MGSFQKYQLKQRISLLMTREHSSLVLSLIVVATIVFDLMISYKYYLHDPQTFIMYEATREAVSFFVDGAMPPMFMVSLFAYPLLIYLGLWWFEHEKSKYPVGTTPSRIAADGKWVFVFAVLSTCFARISAGLTWYDGNTYIMNVVTYILQSMIILCFALAIGSIVLLLVFTKSKRVQQNI